jgi:TetR/AcrR family transcriptional repressor of mexJK operon
MTTVDQPRRRPLWAAKHTAILDAAQRLFLSEGYERASADAIAALAEVSKRTVYDHFGDKEAVYVAVVDRMSAVLTVVVRSAIEEELPDGCDLRRGLLAFARRVATDTFSSSDYVLFRRLNAIRTPGRRVPRAVRNEPKELFAARVARFMEAGVLGGNDPWRVAEHFIALTFLLALDTLDPTVDSDRNELDEILVDGIDAYLRAYT